MAIRSRLLKLVLCFGASLHTFSATYYVAAGGNDANPGTSPETAWKSLPRANSVQLLPGDKLLFKGGDQFSGCLIPQARLEGPQSAPIEISSFGNGRATIVAERQTAIAATNVENLVIRSLIAVGAGPTTNEGYGIIVQNTGPRRLHGLEIDSVDIGGFGKHGVLVTGTTEGYDDVAILRSSMHENLRGGIEVAGKLAWDAKTYAHKNVLVSECRAYNNTGDPDYSANHSGSGIVLYQVDGGKIESCSAWNNGELCPARGGGPVGIWTCASRAVTIEYCESFSNRSKGLDGGGFDIDGGSEECVLQFNYSHDNKGPGLMVYSYPWGSHRDRSNVVRFNISVNDATDSDFYGGLWIRADGGPMENLSVHNNTVVTKGRHAAYVFANNVQVSLTNNILLSGQTGIPLRVDGATNDVAVNFKNNVYWREGSPFLVRWDNRSITSLEQFRGETKQEIAGSEALGAFADPGIARDSGGAQIPLPNLHVLTQFKPAALLAKIGAQRIRFKLNHPLRDFLGNELPVGAPDPLGAIAM